MIQFNNRIDGGFNGKPCKLAETTPYAKKMITEAEEWAEKKRDEKMEAIKRISNEIKELVEKGKEVDGKKNELEAITKELEEVAPKYYKMIGDVMLDFDEGDQDLEFYKSDTFPESTFWGLYHFFLKPWTRMNS